MCSQREILFNFSDKIRLVVCLFSKCSINDDHYRWFMIEKDLDFLLISQDTLCMSLVRNKPHSQSCFMPYQKKMWLLLDQFPLVFFFPQDVPVSFKGRSR